MLTRRGILAALSALAMPWRKAKAALPETALTSGADVTVPRYASGGIVEGVPVFGLRNEPEAIMPFRRWPAMPCAFQLGDTRCNYTGPVALNETCHGTFEECRRRGNHARYGGLPRR